MQQGKAMTILSVKEKVALELAVQDGISHAKRQIARFAEAKRPAPEGLADELGILQDLAARLRATHLVKLEEW